jgi:hypothetical protein
MTSPSEEPDDTEQVDQQVAEHESQSANQQKAEDFPPGPSQGEQETPGANDPQQP